MSLIDSGEPELLKSESDSLVDENCFEARLFRLGAVFCALKQLGKMVLNVALKPMMCGSKRKLLG